MSDLDPAPWMKAAAKEIGHMRGTPWDQKAAVIAKHYAEAQAAELQESIKVAQAALKDMAENPKPRPTHFEKSGQVFKVPPQQQSPEKMRELLELCGPLDPPVEITEPDLALVEALRELGEDHGYGACMRTLSELWAQKVPGGNHTCGPCAGSVKKVLGHD